MAEEPRTLQEAIRRSEERGTYYWCFLTKRGKARRREYLVEARVDLPIEKFAELVPPPGWTLARVNEAGGLVFLHRRQALLDKDLREMFAGLLAYAYERNGRFHSWLHEEAGRDLEDRVEQRTRRPVAGG